MVFHKIKNNTYSLSRIPTVLFVSALILLCSAALPLTMKTTANPFDNNPPYEPSDPTPANGSVNVSLSVNLSWTGGDPDGDPVVYDVYFGDSIPPALLETNLSETSYPVEDLNYSTLYYWRIVAWDNQSASTEGPLWEFTTQDPVNNPPNIPSNPSPANNAIEVPVDVTLSWVGGDPDGDTVYYDVYFGLTTTPALVSEQQEHTTFKPEQLLEFNTTYYWKIIATDEKNATTEGPLWKFTTKKETALTVSILRPVENRLYIQDQERNINLPGDTFVYGPITIKIEAVSDATVTYIHLLINGKLIENFTVSPCEYYWQPLIQFNGPSLTHNIKVVAYDSQGNNASDELNVTKWRFHPLPFIIAGLVVASTLIPHTKIKGFVFNLKQSGLGVSFFAIHIRYSSIGLFKAARGSVNLRRMSFNVVLGPITKIGFGPLHSFGWISCTVLGGIPAVGRGGALGSSRPILQFVIQRNLPRLS